MDRIVIPAPGMQSSQADDLPPMEDGSASRIFVNRLVRGRLRRLA
jgi:hypothetical protein